jgi:pyrroline-5-carboxylate reductase
MSDLFAKSLLKRKKIGFIGTGNLAQAIITALIEDGVMPAEQIYISNRSQGKPAKLKAKYPEINHETSNEALIEKADIIILGMKPQDLQSAVEPLAYAFDEEKVIVSLAAGVTLKNLKRLFSQNNNIIRVMANTPSRVRAAVFGYCSLNHESLIESMIVELFTPLGLVVSAEEGEEFDALTVACASGTGFVLEFLTYWETWLEDRGYENEVAKKMAIETFLGAAMLAKKMDHLSLTELRNQVTSKKGVTLAGLEKMRELEIEGSIAMAFEKAVQRNKQLSID